MIVGILGGGQLARMLALAGIPLGLEFRFFESAATSCVDHLGVMTVGEFTDEDALMRFAADVDVITFESENVPAATLEFLREKYAVYPGVKSLTTAQNRLHEKKLFDALNVKTVQYVAVQSASDLQLAAKQLGFPFIVKTVSGGYDGKGQYRLHSEQDFTDVPFTAGTFYLAEQWLDFDYEVSCVAVRSVDDEIRFYDLGRNQHHDGILYETIPCDNQALVQQAHDYTGRIMRALEHVGTLAVEYFVKDGQLLANEIAPRVHNTGHWTIEAAVCSQFENHLRAICQLPLGDTKRTADYVMTNIIGEWPTNWRELLAQPGLHLHDYKKEPRPGRKLGHYSLLTPHQV